MRAQKKILFIILLLQFLFNVSVFCDLANVHIPIFRQVVGFIYLTFVLGFVLLSLLSKYDFNLVSSIPYIIGLSLLAIIVIGGFLDLFHYWIGIHNPISSFYLTYFISFLVLFLSACNYKFNKFSLVYVRGYDGYIHILLFSLLPFISIFGAYLLNYYNNNSVLVVLYFIIALVPFFVAFDIIPRSIYPFIVWTISISLLFSITLSVRYLSGHLSDATLEYYFAKLVKLNGFWNFGIPRNKNSMLGIVLIHPIYSIVLNLNLNYVFRVVYPIIFSFTPVSLYLAFSKYFDEKTSFYACFFFMSFYIYYVVLSRNTRTGFAEFFLSLFLLSLLDDLNDSTKTLFLVFFAFGIILTHYGTAYVVFAVLIFANLIRYYKYSKLNSKINWITFLVTYCVFMFFWYIYTSSSNAFRTLVYFLVQSTTEISKLFTPAKSYAFYAITRKWVLSIEVTKYLLTLSILFISYKILKLMFNIIKNRNIQITDFSIFSVSSYIILLLSFFVGKRFNPARVYHLLLCFLSPFVFLGFFEICSIFTSLIFFNKLFLKRNYTKKIFSIFLAIFLLFNSGVISEVIHNGDYSPNVILSKPRSSDICDVQYLKSFYSTYLFDQEIISAKWLCCDMSSSVVVKIYMDNPGSGLFFGLLGPGDIARRYIYPKNPQSVKRGYIYLSTLNIRRRIAIVNLYPPKVCPINRIFPLKLCNKIYINTGSEIYITNNV